MQQVSSNLTLFLRIFVPTFWLVFFGAFTLAILLSGAAYFGNVPALLFKGGVTIFYLLGAVVMYVTIMRLKRVEMDADFVYATNYFKTYRYPWHDVVALRQFDLSGVLLVRIQLRQPGSFGKTIPFLAQRKRLEEFLLAHPGLAEKWQ